MKGAGLGNAAVDFDGNDASCAVQFEGRWGIENRVPAQTGQCDKNAVFDAGYSRIALQEGQGMIIAAHLRQHEA